MIIGDKVFKERYKTLNLEQKQAVDEIYGPVMVIAGPGTGKTTILTLRIANILRLTDTAPESILALTFTESGAEAMRKKLSEIIGPTAFRIKIGTFHSFANELVLEYPNYFSKIIGARLTSEIEQISIIREILDNNKFKKLTPKGDRFYYTKKIIDAIRHLKLENLKPTDLDKFTDQEFKTQGKLKGNTSLLTKLENNKDLVLVYKKYEETLKKKRLYDFEDILVETIKAFENHKEFLSEIRENIQFVMADEHQDANGAQNAILELLAGFDDVPNLFIVGDEKQAIYRFQGASLENFLYFKNKFKKAKVISLVKNYRSIQNILDASHSLAQGLEKHNEIERPRLLGKSNQKSPALKLVSFGSEEAEMDFVINEALKINKQGKSVVILTRKNQDAEDLNAYAKRLNIPVSFNNGKEIFSDEKIINLLNIVQAVSDLTNNEKLFSALFADFLELDVVDLFRLSREITEKKLDKKYLIDLMINERFLIEIGLKNSKQILHIAHKFKKWAVFGKNELLTESVDLIAKESGFINKLFTSLNPDESISIYESLHKFLRGVSENNKKAKINDLVKSLELMKSHNAKVISKTPIQDDKKIQIMTMHKSKGLEFDVVFIFRVDDNRLGKNTTRNSFLLPSQVMGHLISENESDEKRLFFVAITRAREKVIISFSMTGGDGKILSPSRFIAEITDNLIEKIEQNDYQTSLVKTLNTRENKTKNRKGEPGSEIAIYAKSLFLENGLNATALNNYLKCPWQYFFQNLIRIPKNMQEHQIYGSAIHEAIRTNLLNKKVNFEKSFTRFKDYLNKSIIDSKTEKRLLERGEKALKEFLLDFKIPKDFKSEHKISGVPLKLASGEIINLGGKLDLIEKLEFGYKVTDFKTGNPKSRNEILGETKTSTGDIYRQLIFYKILTEDQSQNFGKMEIGEIRFVEPAKNGKLKTENFVISEKEKVDLIEKLKEVSEEILGLKFWSKTCSEKDCEFCGMAEKLKN